MSRESSQFFGSGKDCRLNGEEKNAVWQKLQSHMQANPSEIAAVSATEEAEMASVFACTADDKLTDAERADVRESLRAHTLASEFFVPAKSVVLTPEERTDTYAILRDRMATETGQDTMPFWETIIAIIGTRLLAPGLAAVLLVSAGASITYAAGYALPGDFLYPVKQMHEQVRTGLHFSRESKAEAETNRLGTRVEEVKILQEKQLLTEAVTTTVDQEFRLERRRAIMQLQLLEQDGKTEAAARIRTRLNAIEDSYHALLGLERDEEGDTTGINISIGNSASSVTQSSRGDVITSSIASSAADSSSQQSSHEATSSAGIRIEVQLPGQISSDSATSDGVSVQIDASGIKAEATINEESSTESEDGRTSIQSETKAQAHINISNDGGDNNVEVTADVDSGVSISTRVRTK